MNDLHFNLLAAAVALVLLLQLALLLRKPRFDTPPDLNARLALLEQQMQALTQASTLARSGSERIEQQLRAFTDTTAAGLQAQRLALDTQLARTVDESRLGRRELMDGFQALEGRLEQRIAGVDIALIARFASLQDGVSQQLRGMAQGSQHSAELLRTALNERLAAIQQDNTAKLEEMRRTVDEKLHATLEQRLGESFKLVSERLEQVHAGLGEMKTLAGSVGDLKRVMSNVRTRGTWGEVQLGAIIDSLLTAEQFERNVKTVPGSNDLVEFAVRMPGKSDDVPVWLPIDSKYPVEHYQRLLDAHDTLDKTVVKQALAAFESSLRLEAKKIAGKYLSPPHTTDFAILFLPTEGLFAEAARAPGLLEALQNEHRVVVAGPTTLAAVLNSLRLGFRTLAIEKRSSEVWGILASVKTEFHKFGDIVESTRKSIDAAANKFTELGRRTRAIRKSLLDVHELPATAATTALLATAGAAVLPDDDGSADETDAAGAG